MLTLVHLRSPTEGPHLYAGFGDINGMAFPDLDVPQPMFNLPVFSNLNGLDWAGQQQNIVVRVGDNQIMNSTDCKHAALSKDYGVTWDTFQACIPGINVSSTDGGTIAIDASGKHLVWSATSSALEGSSTVITKVSGPYYSHDESATWHSPTGLSIQTPNISADRVQPATFYSFTDGRFYTSTNGGKTYTSYAAADIGLPDHSGAVPVVSFDIAGHLWLSLGAEGIYYSSTFGKRWTKITVPGVNPELFTVGAPAPGASSPSLFLWGTASMNSTFGLYRSDDNGKSWVRVNDDFHQYGG